MLSTSGRPGKFQVLELQDQLSIRPFGVGKIPTYHVIILLNIKDGFNVVFILALKMVNCAAFRAAVWDTPCLQVLIDL